ncbi:hypothetical protein G6F35_014178 [Rhizopus arrhizus]|nr:hypothetical protein G6F35_014178 [Rhizopus arrhizus]
MGVSYAVVFILVLLGVGLVNMTLSALIRSTGLSPADHGLGGMFGLARGLVIVLALVAAANARPVPIPVYAEMSSINPVFLMPAALEARAEAIARGFVDSLAMGAPPWNVSAKRPQKPSRPRAPPPC